MLDYSRYQLFCFFIISILLVIKNTLIYCWCPCHPHLQSRILGFLIWHLYHQLSLVIKVHSSSYVFCWYSYYQVSSSYYSSVTYHLVDCAYITSHFKNIFFFRNFKSLVLMSPPHVIHVIILCFHLKLFHNSFFPFCFSNFSELFY